MSADLPPELVDRARRLFSIYDRGILGLDEFESRLSGEIATFAMEQLGGAPAEPAWQRCWAEYALELARTDERATGLVRMVFDSPRWSGAFEPVQALLIEAAQSGTEALDVVWHSALLASWRRVLPPEVREAVRAAPAGSGIAMVDLLESDVEGDADRVAEIVAASSQGGCVSPAVELIRFRREQQRSTESAVVSDLLDLETLARRHDFGGITHFAVELLADGHDEAALAWSAAVDDDRVFHKPPTSDHDAHAAYRVDRSARPHGPLCLPLCNEHDARLLGALAVVDWIGGSPARALVRAAACDQGSDRLGWSATGVELLAGWVLSREAEARDRMSALDALIDRARSSHVELGPLGVQLHGELAELHGRAGNETSATCHEQRAQRCVGEPVMSLHMEAFQYPDLFLRLPSVQAGR